MKKLPLSLFLFALVLFLAGCGTIGSVKADREELKAAYASVKPEGELTVVFDQLPGRIGDSFCTGPGAWSEASLDANAVAAEAAQEVFKCLFEYVFLKAPGTREMSNQDLNPSGTSKVLRLRVSASTSSFSGAHTAEITVRAYDENDKLLFEYSDKETVYNAIQYGQATTMERAFIKVFRRVADRFLAERAAGK